MTNNGEKVRPILNSSSIIVDDAEPAARYGRAWLATLQKDAIKKTIAGRSLLEHGSRIVLSP